jgi:hypothetical protein
MRAFSSLFLFLMTAILAPQAAAQVVPAPAADLFPLAEGNRWTYARTGPAAGSRFDVKVSGTVPHAAAPGGVAFALEGYFGTGATSLVYQSRARLVLEAGRQRDTLWYRIGALPGTRWRFLSTTAPTCSDDLPAILVSRRESVDVPAGRFGGCVRIVYRPACSDAGSLEEIFAPGVGLVRRTEESFAGPVTHELVSAVVGGRALPPHPIEVSISINEQSFIFGGAPPPVPRPAPKLVVRLTVRAEGGPQTFRFGTTQRYDIRVLDEQGTEVYRWSRGQAFRQVPGTETALPGRPLVFEQEIPVISGGGPGSSSFFEMRVEATLWNERAAKGVEEHVARTSYTVGFAP